MNPIQITPSLLIDLSDELADYQVLGFSIGANYQLYLILSTVKGIGEPPRKRRILQTNGSYLSRYELPVEFAGLVRPIGNNEWLLIRGSGNSGDNAFILGDDWNVKQSFFVGADVLDVQVTRDNHIWIIYGDMGYGDNPKLLNEAQGFVASKWDSNGSKQFVFLPPTSGLDCYAMNNITNDETWFYTHPNFPLTQVIGNKTRDYWQSGVKGSYTFAIWRDYVMFCGSYENRLIFPLYQLLDNHQMKHIANYQFFEQPTLTKARGSLIIGFQDTKLYQIDLKDIISNL